MINTEKTTTNSYISLKHFNVTIMREAGLLAFRVKINECSRRDVREYKALH